MTHATTNPTAGRPLRHQALRYAGLSVLSFSVNLSLVVALHEWAGLASYLAVAIAMVLVTVMNFCSIRLLVFDRTAKAGRWGTQFAGYLASTAGFRAAEYIAFLVLCGVLAQPYLPSYAAVLAISVVGKFLFLRGVVFAGPHKPARHPEAAL